VARPGRSGVGRPPSRDARAPASDGAPDAEEDARTSREDRGALYRHVELDFLILDPKSGQHLRGAGLTGHLMRAHGFFEGPANPYRLDPERAAQVLSLHG
jgi:hypothetical protein